jgi:ElaB/YqjD/DUF883 family membrane-anchored ribosome-binding protein
MSYETNRPGTGRDNEPAAGLSDDTLTASSGLGEDTPGASSEARATAANIGRRAKRAEETVRSTTADSLESAANAVHSGGTRVASAAHSAADALASGARYVRDHETRDMIEDFLELVRNNPGPALLGAVALGFLVGRTLSRD